jgi:tetratricopeptide (TPR) repeat protein
VGLADVGATIVDLAGGGGALPGRSLRGAMAGGAAPGGLYAESLAPQQEFGWSDLRSWREGSMKYIRAPRPELYDVDADPGETRDVAAARPEDVARMERALAKVLADAGEVQARRGPDPEAAERLRALGYVQGPGGRGSGADPKDKLEVARRIARAAGPFPDFATAARVYREIADLDPENPLVRFRLADALLRAGRAEEAVPHFRKVVEGGPRTADPFVGLATAYALLGRLDDARRVLVEALSVDPANGQVHFNLGEVARAHGDFADARRRYEAALADSTTRDRAKARLAGLP